MRITLAIILMLITASGFGQTQTLQKADEYFNAFNYNKAIKEYKKVIDEGQNQYVATQQIALCYSKLNKSSEAVNWYKKVIEFPDFDYNYYFLLFRELQKQKDYDEAQIYMKKYLSKIPNANNQSISNLDNYIATLKKDSLRYQINHLGFNTSFDEYAPVFYGDEIVFSSNRPTLGLIKSKDIRTGDSFYHLYKIIENKINDSKATSIFSPNLVSKYNDGSVSFNSDLTTLFLTRNTTDKKDGLNNLDLFVAIKKGDEWSKDVQVLFNHKGTFNVAHAFVDSKRQLIYFCSDMPGGYGGMDLYVSTIKDGFVSKPKNLGPKINTIGNELFPFISSDNMLYFASDGKPGLGGYDLFFAKPESTGFSQAFNLEYPLNTAYDDISLVLDSKNEYGYFASNRPGSYGGDDIYSVDIMQKLDYCKINGTVITSKDSIPIQDAWVEIENQNHSFKQTIFTNKQGQFSIYLKKNDSYELLIRKKLFQNLSYSLSNELLEEDKVTVMVQLIEK